VATTLRANKLIVLDTFTLPNFDNTDSSEITTNSISKWLEKEPDLQSEQKIQLTALTEGCVRGVERCHLLDGSIEGGIACRGAYSKRIWSYDNQQFIQTNTILQG